MRQTEWSYELRLDAQASSVAAAREFVRRYLVRHGLLLLVEDVRLVVSELATNALMHAQTPFTVTLTGGERFVRLTVWDGVHESPVQVAASLMDTGGRGINIVEQLASRWGVTNADATGHAKCVWASFEVPQEDTATSKDRA